MKKARCCFALLLILLFAAAFTSTGCRSHSGSREFIPGRGWVPNDG